MVSSKNKLIMNNCYKFLILNLKSKVKKGLRPYSSGKLKN